MTDYLTDKNRDALLADELALINAHTDWGQAALFAVVDAIVAEHRAAALRDVVSDVLDVAMSPVNKDDPDYDLGYNDALRVVRRALNPYRANSIGGDPAPCIGNDLSCPCQDGLLCHYKGDDAWPLPDGGERA